MLIPNDKDANALQEMLIGSAYPRQDKSNFLLPFLSFLDDDIFLETNVNT